YDPMVHLNQLFDSPESLGELNQLLDYSNNYKINLDKKIYKKQILYNKKNSNLSSKINYDDDISNLISEINETRSLAEKTQQTISNMTFNIQNLDQGKKNLVLSMTVLKRLQMLLTAYDQLNNMLSSDAKDPNSSSNDYNEMLNLISVVIQLNLHFQNYKNISEINLLSKDISKLKINLTDQIFSDFESLLGGKKKNPHSQSNASQLIKACEILDIIGQSYHDKLLNLFITLQFKEFKSIFNISDEAGSLENLSRRYIYFKKIFRNFNDYYYKFFSKSYGLKFEICKRFCEFTKDDLKLLLNNIKQDNLNNKNNNNNNSINNSGDDNDSSSNSIVNILLKTLSETLEFEDYLNKSNNNSTFFTKKISIAFEPYLSIWLDQQSSIISKNFLKYMAAPKLSPAQKDINDNSSIKQEDIITDVIPSSAELFRTYRQILNHAIKLSNGLFLLNLTDLYVKHLNDYNEKILKPLFPKNDRDLIVSEGVDYLILIFNTSDYINITIDQLVEKLKSLITPELSPKVEAKFENSKEIYVSLITDSMNKLLTKIDLDCELSWKEMTNNNWKLIRDVSDQSRYIIDLKEIILKNLRKFLFKFNRDVYVKNFMDKLVEFIIKKFLSKFISLKPISIITAEQILLDLSTLKDFFKNLPKTLAMTDSEIENELKNQAQSNRLKSFESSENKLAIKLSKSYFKTIDLQYNKFEKILKMIMIDNKDKDNLISNYFLIVGDKNFNNFLKILTLKGIVYSP
ncbi:Vps53p, partial [Ascoidea rubescens DSM 1968]